MKKSKAAIIFILILSLAAFYILNRAATCYLNLEGNPVEKVNATISLVFPQILDNPIMIGRTSPEIYAGLGGMAIIWLIYLYNITGKKNYMHGIEHGSARWGTKSDITPLMDKDPDFNIPLSATEAISSRKVKDFEADRNKNIVIVGGSGSGKTFSEVKPSLMQLHSSYVMTDPKGTLLPETGYLFTENGYKVRCFNTVDFKKSLHYNPLVYIRSEKDILKLVTVLISNTNGEGNQSGDKFWQDCEKLLYTALIAYLWYEAPREDMSIPMMIDMLEMCKAKEDDEDYQSPIDILFEDLGKEKPECLAVKQYKKFKQAAGKTMKSILISCAARLAPFDIAELREIMQYDELQLDEIGDYKTAFYIVMSDNDPTYSFLIAMIMSQMFTLLCDKADVEYHGKLPFHVRCILDEFANIGKIPNFHQLISTIRSRNISVVPILQSVNQLSSIYKDDAETIVDCCDTFVFLGGKATKTTKQVSEMIGKTTIDNQNVNESKGQNGSYSLQSQVLGRDLIDPAEVGRLKRTQCLVLIAGLPPFKSKKYKTAKHKRYSFLYDSGKRPYFDISKAQVFSDKHFLDNVESVQEVDLSELNVLT